MYQFFAYISRMKYISRWSLMRSSVQENIQEHSHMAAVLAHALGVIRRDVFGLPCSPDACAAAALFHDATEIFTGDLPTPIKYYSPAIREAYRQVEEGNREFADAARETLEALRAMEMPEISWFLDHFSEAFGLTLDGLQRM